VFVEDSSNSVKKERQLFYCISVPALTSWVKEYLVTDKHRKSESKPLHHQNKRTHPDESTSGDEMLCSSDSSPVTSAKRLCSNNHPASSQSRCNVERCLPVPDSVATTCLVKVRSLQSVHRIVCSELKWKWECSWYKFMLRLKICRNNLGLNLCMYNVEWNVYWRVTEQLLLMVNTDVHGSVHHNINRIEITNKMRPCSRNYYSNVS